MKSFVIKFNSRDKKEDILRKIKQAMGITP
jgi:hypothetical protein